MSETYTFRCSNNRMEFTVKKEFLETCPEPNKFNEFQLVSEKNIIKHLHNPRGPAMVRVKDNYGTYWLNGHLLTPEETERVKHDTDFYSRIMSEDET